MYKCKWKILQVSFFFNAQLSNYITIQYNIETNLSLIYC